MNNISLEATEEKRKIWRTYTYCKTEIYKKKFERAKRKVSVVIKEAKVDYVNVWILIL